MAITRSPHNPTAFYGIPSILAQKNHYGNQHTSAEAQWPSVDSRQPRCPPPAPFEWSYYNTTAEVGKAQRPVLDQTGQVFRGGVKKTAGPLHVHPSTFRMVLLYPIQKEMATSRSPSWRSASGLLPRYLGAHPSIHVHEVPDSLVHEGCG